MITNESSNGLNTPFIKLMKAAGALVNPKDMTCTHTGHIWLQMPSSEYLGV